VGWCSWSARTQTGCSASLRTSRMPLATDTLTRATLPRPWLSLPREPELGAL
jgi:hypothetical protein